MYYSNFYQNIIYVLVIYDVNNLVWFVQVVQLALTNPTPLFFSAFLFTPVP